MRYPAEWYRLEAMIGTHLTELRPAHRRGLALWVYGTVLAGSACQSAVVAALMTMGRWDALRQHLREWLYDGTDRAAPCGTTLKVEECFAPLLRWVVGWWQGKELALAVDATTLGDQVVALVVSVLYRGSALPVAWAILPAKQRGAWMPHLLRLLRVLRRAVPPGMTVLVLADRGLWSPRLWKRIRDLGWHPLLRVRDATTFAPLGQRRQPARALVPGPGYAWIGAGTAFKHREVRRTGTLIVMWGADQPSPWVLMTDLPPARVGVAWYGLRVWIELGFRSLKRLGWQWQNTRRTDPDRVARHWLVLAVATLWTIAIGTRVEDATAAGLPPARLHAPRARLCTGPRRVSVFRLGLTAARHLFLHGRLWCRLWLAPDPLPNPPPNLHITFHLAPLPHPA